MNDGNLRKKIKYEWESLLTVWIFMEQTVTEKRSKRLVHLIRKVKDIPDCVACVLHCLCPRVYHKQREILL